MSSAAFHSDRASGRVASAVQRSISAARRSVSRGAGRGTSSGAVAGAGAGVESSVHNPQYLAKLKEYMILMEFKHLRDGCPPGVYVLPENGNLRVWHGVLFLRTGLYRNGVFKFTIELPEQYPEHGPRVVFVTSVYNPLVSNKTNELDLSIQFPKWDHTKHNILAVLEYVKAVFYKPEFWKQRMRHEPFNKDAQYNWQHNRAKFEKKCQDCVSRSLHRVYINGDSPIRFERQRHEHSLVLNRIFREDTEADGAPAMSAPASSTSTPSSSSSSSTAAAAAGGGGGAAAAAAAAASTTTNSSLDGAAAAPGTPSTPAHASRSSGYSHPGVNSGARSTGRRRDDGAHRTDGRTPSSKADALLPADQEEDEEERLSRANYASWFSDGVNSLTAYQQKFRTPRRSSHLGVSPMKEQ